MASMKFTKETITMLMTLLEDNSDTMDEKTFIESTNAIKFLYDNLIKNQHYIIEDTLEDTLGDFNNFVLSVPPSPLRYNSPQLLPDVPIEIIDHHINMMEIEPSSIMDRDHNISMMEIDHHNSMMEI